MRHGVIVSSLVVTALCGQLSMPTGMASDEQALNTYISNS